MSDIQALEAIRALAQDYASKLKLQIDARV